MRELHVAIYRMQRHRETLEIGLQGNHEEVISYCRSILVHTSSVLCRFVFD